MSRSFVNFSRRCIEKLKEPHSYVMITLSIFKERQSIWQFPSSIWRPGCPPSNWRVPDSIRACNRRECAVKRRSRSFMAKDRPDEGGKSRRIPSRCWRRSRKPGSSGILCAASSSPLSMKIPGASPRICHLSPEIRIIPGEMTASPSWYFKRKEPQRWDKDQSFLPPAAGNSAGF